jgi:hypothetical protein
MASLPVSRDRGNAGSRVFPWTIPSRGGTTVTGSQEGDRESPVRFIGCCGACCRTCRALEEGACRGCKLGYGEGDRDISRAKCRMKVCCFGEKHLETCADCPEYPACGIIRGFQSKKGYKYRKYRESLEFIRKKGYPAFLMRADAWKGPYGRLE